MKCFNCYSEFLPTISKPLCQKCGICYYCRDFISYFYHDIDNHHKQKQKHKERHTSPSACNEKNPKGNLYNELLVSPIQSAITNYRETLIVIDESVRRKLGKLHFLDFNSQNNKQRKK